MNGIELTKIIDQELERKKMTQKEFCAAIGVGSSAMSAWRKGAMPKPERLKEIEACLNIDFSDYEMPKADDESAQLLEMIRDRQDLRILLHSAKDVPPSSVYSLISQIEKAKEDTI